MSMNMIAVRDWKMKYVSKVGDVGLRAKLKATVNKKKAAKGRRDDTNNIPNQQREDEITAVP